MKSTVRFLETNILLLVAALSAPTQPIHHHGRVRRGSCLGRGAPTPTRANIGRILTMIRPESYPDPEKEAGCVRFLTLVRVFMTVYV